MNLPLALRSRSAGCLPALSGVEILSERPADRTLLVDLDVRRIPETEGRGPVAIEGFLDRGGEESVLGELGRLPW